MGKRDQVMSAVNSFKSSVKNSQIIEDNEKVAMVRGARHMINCLAMMGMFGSQLAVDAKQVLIEFQDEL